MLITTIFGLISTVASVMLYLYGCWRFSEIQHWVNKYHETNLFLWLALQISLWVIALSFLLGIPGIIFLTAMKVLGMGKEVTSILLFSAMFLGVGAYFFGERRAR